jgi:AAA+ superfamily predicted ATPase
MNSLRLNLSPQFSAMYKATARVGAYGLPEHVDGGLLHAYCAVTRGESFVLPENIEEFDARYNDWHARVKRSYHESLRIAKLQEDEEAASLNISYLLYKHPDYTLGRAMAAMFNAIQAGAQFVAGRDEMAECRDLLKTAIVGWLRDQAIAVPTDSSITIPLTRISQLVNNFAGKPDLFIQPDIPGEKLENACKACCIPESERVAVLIDCTFFGSASDAVVIGTRGAYFSNEGTAGYIPFGEFPDTTFTPRTRGGGVNYGIGDWINLNGSNLPPGICVELLDVLRRAVIATSASHRLPGTQVAIRGLDAVAGMSALKKLLNEEVIEPLKHVEKYRRYKLTIPNGILMYGPPGCGKTFIARHLADELNYDFFEIVPSTLASTYVHGTVEKIQQAFAEAARHAPAMIFVDEFESLVPNRTSISAEHAYKAEEVNEWLVQLNECSARNLIFVAATNCPAGIDPAVLRTGRIDKKIFVGPPDREAIQQMLLHHLQGRPVSTSSRIPVIAAQLENLGYSASDLKALSDEASRAAMRDDLPISDEHFLVAAARVPASLSSSAYDQESFLEMFQLL